MTRRLDLEKVIHFSSPAECAQFGGLVNQLLKELGIPATVRGQTPGMDSLKITVSGVPVKREQYVKTRIANMVTDAISHGLGITEETEWYDPTHNRLLVILPGRSKNGRQPEDPTPSPQD